MQERIDAFMALAAKRNANEPEFLQAVQEVAETVIPFIEKNPKYDDYRILERMIEPEELSFSEFLGLTIKETFRLTEDLELSLTQQLDHIKEDLDSTQA